MDTFPGDAQTETETSRAKMGCGSEKAKHSRDRVWERSLGVQCQYLFDYGRNTLLSGVQQSGRNSVGIFDFYVLRHGNTRFMYNSGLFAFQYGTGRLQGCRVEDGVLRWNTDEKNSRPGREQCAEQKSMDDTRHMKKINRKQNTGNGVLQHGTAFPPKVVLDSVYGAGGNTLSKEAVEGKSQFFRVPRSGKVK